MLELNGMDLKLRYKNKPFNFQELGVLTAPDASRWSTTIQRVCRATLQAKTYALQNAQEAGDKVRALLAELFGYGTTGPDWHDASRTAIPHVMLLDCRSLVANLNTEVPSRVQDERLQIELDAIRQSIFHGEAYGRGLPKKRRPCRLGNDGDTNSRLPHKEHEAHIHAQGSESMPVPDLARRVFQTQRRR